MRFRHYDQLRAFDVVAQHLSISRAAEALCLTKGAISYQIRQLEQELGFSVFIRQPGRITLSDKGKQLWHISQHAFRQIEQEIVRLREDDKTRITIGTTTYFASRWLSPRLMTFISEHPQVSLRIQPMLDLTNLRAENIDMAIRWGKGEWTDMHIEPLFNCPTIVTAGTTAAQKITEQGIGAAIQEMWLLHDREESDAWEDWFQAAGLTYRPRREELVIQDPNVRVQAVVDGQGIALNDSLVANELASGVLQQVSDVQLEEYGYFLAYSPEALDNSALRNFRLWLLAEAAKTSTLNE